MSRGRGGWARVGATLLSLLGIAAAAPAAGQYVIRAPSGDSLTFEQSRVLQMLERSRELRDTLELDPRVLYFVGTGSDATAAEPAPAYPWNAVQVRSDSVARIAIPGNYREGDRAYFNYAVNRMWQVRREPPTASCETALEREERLVSSFTDGWIVARVLYGGPPFPPLDAFAFAREAGHLPTMLIALGDKNLGGCLERWQEDNRDRIEGFQRWYLAEFLGDAAEEILPPVEESPPDSARRAGTGARR